MNSEFIEIKDIEKIAQEAEAGADVSEYFTGHFEAKQHIDIAFPLELLKSIDAACERHKISCQDWIQMVCREKVREIQTGVVSQTD